MYVDKNVPLELDREIISDGTGSYNNKWTLYVPKGCKSAYSKAPYWRSFASIVEDASLSGDGSIVEDEDEGGEDDNQSREYVDLGLPSGTLWATRNVGAASPADYGDYFAWGETSPKTDYDWDTYKWCNGSSKTQTKYNTRSSYGTVDNKTVLEAADDAATANWGSAWRMPTTEEQIELLSSSYCTWTWTTRTNSAGITINGYEVKSKSNGNSIFLPAAGYRGVTSLIYAGSYGYYWSSSLYSGIPYRAYGLDFNSGDHYWSYYSDYRYYGLSVRPVRASARN